MATTFAKASRNHYVSGTSRFALFDDVVGKKTSAFFCLFPGATLEQSKFRKYLPNSLYKSRHFLTNFVVHRFFYHPEISSRIGFAHHAEQVITAIDECTRLKIKFRTNAYQRSISNDVMKAAVREMFELLPPFWEQYYTKSCTDDFPIAELVDHLQPVPQLGSLGVALCVQDLATAGIITQKALEAALSMKDAQNRDMFNLLGDGGVGGLRLMVPQNLADSMTPNEQLLKLYQDLHQALDIKEGEENWKNVTTVEHLACKLFRLAAFCTRRPERQPDFWRAVGRADLASAGGRA